MYQQLKQEQELLLVDLLHKPIKEQEQYLVQLDILDTLEVVL
jgi:hypothetical protein